MHITFSLHHDDSELNCTIRRRGGLIFQIDHYLVANKDWLPLMLYEEIFSINNLKKVLSLLGIDIQRLREDELQRNLDNLGIDPDLFTAGLFLVSPLAAIITFILSKTIMAKLSEKYEKQSLERFANYGIDEMHQ